MNMRNKFILRNFSLFLFPMLIPILILSSILMLNSYHTSKRTVDENISSITSLTELNFEMMMSDYEFQKIILGDNSRLTIPLIKLFYKDNLDYEDLKISQIIKSIISVPTYAKRYISAIYLYTPNANNRILSSTKGLTILDELSAADLIDLVSENNTSSTVKRIIPDPVRKGRHIDVVTVFQRNVTSNYSTIIDFDQEFFNEELEQYTNFKDQGILITDENNNPLFYNRYAENFNIQTLTAELKENSAAEFEFKGGKINYIVSTRHITGTSNKVITFIPRSIIYEDLNHTVVISILVTGFVTFLAMLIAYYIANRNYSHLSEIVNVFNYVEETGKIPLRKETEKNSEYTYILNNIIDTFLKSSYLQYREKLLELSALQLQINPHFLFNTLQTIDYEVIGAFKKRNHINLMISSLSDLLHYSLENPNEEVSVGDEIENTKSYITIQQVRYSNQFELDWNYAENVTSRKIIKLILQPLIENSLYHGIKEKEGSGIIRVSIKEKNQSIIIKVLDNGAGMTKAQLNALVQKLADTGNHDPLFPQSKAGHIGLINCHRRLHLKYGEKYSLKVKSKYGLGTSVCLTIQDT